MRGVAGKECVNGRVWLEKRVDGKIWVGKFEWRLVARILCGGMDVARKGMSVEGCG